MRGDRLVREIIHADEGQLNIGDLSLDLDQIQRIVVVGAGKAGAGMAAGLEAALGPRLMEQKQLEGWINVPADCVESLRRIKLHPARPAGVNEPTEAGVGGAETILQLVGSLSEKDLCLCLISGGGSALLPAPVAEITLADKQAVTTFLSAAGANIQELNTVRKKLSRIKGGGLARACRAGRLISLTISDVIGDPLDIIASGPTVPDPATDQDAIDVLDRFQARAAGLSPAVYAYLEAAAGHADRALSPITAEVHNLVIGNNAAAVDAAGMEAERRGYSHAMNAATDLEGHAEEIGQHLAAMAVRMRDQPGPDCLITGGEPIVKLAPADRRGKGGRNQQLALAALEELLNRNPDCPLGGIVLLAGGTDGEDGPTDAAGAMIDVDTARRMENHELKPSDYLDRNDAYTFFEQTGGLIKTGPTHTNVCDLRVVTVNRVEQRPETTP